MLKILDKGENMKRNVKNFNRYFTCILYPDDKRFYYLLNYIKKNFFEVTYIYHDRDINENGEVKKLHIHIIFKVGDNARSVFSVCEELQYNIALIEGCSCDSMLLYLLHKNNPEKTQYNFDEVKGDTSRLLYLLEKSKPQNDRYKEFVNDIFNNHINNLSDLLQLAISTNKIDILLKSQYLFVQLINSNKTIDKLNKFK